MNAEIDRHKGRPWEFKEAAEWLRISERHLIRLCDRGLVRVIRIGRRRLLPDEQVQRLAAEGLPAKPVENRT